MSYKFDETSHRWYHVRSCGSDSDHNSVYFVLIEHKANNPVTLKICLDCGMGGWSGICWSFQRPIDGNELLSGFDVEGFRYD